MTGGASRTTPTSGGPSRSTCTTGRPGGPPCSGTPAARPRPPATAAPPGPSSAPTGVPSLSSARRATCSPFFRDGGKVRRDWSETAQRVRNRTSTPHGPPAGRLARPPAETPQEDWPEDRSTRVLPSRGRSAQQLPEGRRPVRPPWRGSRGSPSRTRRRPAPAGAAGAGGRRRARRGEPRRPRLRLQCRALTPEAQPGRRPNGATPAGPRSPAVPPARPRSPAGRGREIRPALTTLNPLSSRKGSRE
jgi:hypothetical protein